MIRKVGHNISKMITFIYRDPSSIDCGQSIKMSTDGWMIVFITFSGFQDQGF